MGLYWLSFLRDGKFAGACIVDATDDAAALSRADALGIHPGGGDVEAMSAAAAGLSRVKPPLRS